MMPSPNQTDERQGTDANITEDKRRHWRQILANEPQMVRYA